MNIFKRHPIISGIIVFVLFTLPSAINAYLSLYERFTGISVPPLNLGFGVWLLPLIGGVLGILIIWQGRRANKPSELEDIKTALVNIIIYQREVALKKVQQVCPEETARKIISDFTAIFGEDRIAFLVDSIRRMLSEGSIGPFVEYFKTYADILDNNKYGLKIELEGNELYKSSQMDLAQKRLKLKVGKKKGATIQKNIDMVCSLCYGLNSSILMRGVVDSNPGLKSFIPAKVRVEMEGIESRSEAGLNTMLNDLEGDWKLRGKKRIKKKYLKQLDDLERRWKVDKKEKHLKES